MDIEWIYKIDKYHVCKRNITLKYDVNSIRVSTVVTYATYHQRNGASAS